MASSPNDLHCGSCRGLGRTIPCYHGISEGTAFGIRSCPCCEEPPSCPTCVLDTAAAAVSEAKVKIARMLMAADVWLMPEQAAQLVDEMWAHKLRIAEASWES